MKNIVENINCILAEWNPIGVPKNIANEEYKGYISLIIQSVESREKLMICLEDLLKNKLGLDYDDEDKAQKESLEHLCDNIIRAYKFTNEVE
jgi:hypothetical protein